MPIPPLSSIAKSLGIGALIAFIITAIMLPLVIGGVIGVTEPFAARFVSVLSGDAVAVPFGMLLHFVWVWCFATLYALLWYQRPFANAVMVSGLLWLVQVAAAYPIVGWGFLGLNVPSSTALASLVPHVLLAIILSITGVLMNRSHRRGSTAMPSSATSHSSPYTRENQ